MDRDNDPAIDVTALSLDDTDSTISVLQALHTQILHQIQDAEGQVAKLQTSITRLRHCHVRVVSKASVMKVKEGEKFFEKKMLTSTTPPTVVPDRSLLIQEGSSTFPASSVDFRRGQRASQEMMKTLVNARSAKEALEKAVQDQ